jgi:hypothetical protein
MDMIIEIMISVWALIVDLTNSIFQTIMALGATYPTTAAAVGGALIIGAIVDVRRNGI